MKRRYTLENLGCANCAAKMEEKIKELDGVNSVTVNFITTKMVLDVEDDKFDSVLNQAKDIIKSIEPYVEVK
ncbi:MAG: heavy-metal-associated domain-containing protein [Finegoldia magna]|uniref:cation transporter n=1 Tax=Finegoldia TaxID=150022 RepID=UPI000B91AB52|nr:heavy-metal-associated domain-containing protein [Finegoldia magna]MDU1832126.1 heavy-metal-associated domain-containing protein [Finegoldia magna]MDU1879312.1 heavy-metal-associated domain-containing protein [Finegoldia magna]MDU4210221.1 heavy-metal-associated domain-containing protein [Finegoldia magna]MDU5369161.1 heavy-metal-associated domain-containing protein [Finegoldia magna]MDU5443398.1 heavy-metal-associated domain-containing protein [Finegoldia magna]